MLGLAGYWSLLGNTIELYPKLDTSFTWVALLYSVITVAVFTELSMPFSLTAAEGLMFQENCIELRI